ncbi:MAG: hypothetical protein ACHQ53_12135 [Polyangiales bacterium]
MSRSWRSLSVLAAVVAVACASSSPSGPSVAELPGLLAENACTSLEGCFDSRTLRYAFGDAGCKVRLQAAIEDSDFGYVQDSIDAGRVSYDASKVDGCLDAIKALGCSFSTTRLFEKDACKGVFTGHAKAGAKCTVGEDCDSGLFCQHDATTCPGTCKALLKPGSTCDSADQCADGLACSKSTATCEEPSHAGEACGGGVAGECAGGLSCVGDDETTGTAGMCRHTNSILVGKLGDTCDIKTGALCTEGLTCAASIKGGTASFDCEMLAAADASCRFGVPAPCQSDQYCSADISLGQIDGKCTPAPAAGESCLTLTGSPACAPGLFCDVDARCHPVNRLGQPCVSDDGCASGLCTSGKCQRPKQCTL